ncbi:hypothetical protein like AT4G29090 [Hibiscus trionum]|uniref:RNase H type-1 domain-containing protein n=1 Tax=Hibiscus trionum TaxID=183268 RepID=A0A9W7MIV5_HIBTR|nr:hypothetical protein like AT4G29090 [Hibiscus trionum]
MQSTLLPKGVCDHIERIVRQFVWGSSNTDHKIPLVNWEAIRQPMANGGLGFRSMFDYNVAFVHKIGFNFISKPAALWVSLLRQKYRVVDICPPSIQCVVATPLWRAIAAHWDAIRSGVAWSLGNGQSTRFLDDAWIPEIGHLRPFSLRATADFDHLTVNELVDENGTWNFPLLSSIFPPDIIAHIKGIKCPDLLDCTDTCVWRWSTSQKFSISSAYKHLQEPAWDTESPVWKLFWQCPVPQRVRIFCWLVFRQKLLTNTVRCQRRLTDDSSCPLCAHPQETNCHTLRDCPAATEVWKRVIPAALRDTFFTMTAATWLCNNLSSRLIDTQTMVQWPVLFASTLWQIWKNRNDVVFNNADVPASVTLRRSIAWAKCYGNSQATHSATLHPSRAVVWHPPIQGGVCLNVDGSSSSSSKHCSIGGLLRDTNGSWLWGFYKHVGTASVLQTELWAIYIGLLQAWEHGYEMLEVQSDCKQTVALVSDTTAGNSPLSLVRAIRNLCCRAWLVEFVWIPRDANRPSDGLSKMADCSTDDLILLEDPPPSIARLIEQDSFMFSSANCF